PMAPLAGRSYGSRPTSRKDLSCPSISRKEEVQLSQSGKEPAPGNQAHDRGFAMLRLETRQLLSIAANAFVVEVQQSCVARLCDAARPVGHCYLCRGADARTNGALPVVRCRE